MHETPPSHRRWKRPEGQFEKENAEGVYVGTPANPWVALACRVVKLRVSLRRAIKTAGLEECVILRLPGDRELATKAKVGNVDSWAAIAKVEQHIGSVNFSVRDSVTVQIPQSRTATTDSFDEEVFDCHIPETQVVDTLGKKLVEITMVEWFQQHVHIVRVLIRSLKLH